MRYCFGCGAGGDVIRLVMLATHSTFPRALEALAAQYCVPLPQNTPTASLNLEDVLAAATEHFKGRLQGPLGSQARHHLLVTRQLPQHVLDRFHVGYAADSQFDLVNELSSSSPWRNPFLRHRRTNQAQ